MTARRLSNVELKERVGAAFGSVFASTDAYGAPFTDDVQCRAILCPFGGLLFREEFEAILEAARELGDSTVYLWLFEEREQPYYEVSSFEEYEPISSSLQFTAFGPSGSWGITVSDEDHAVVGGSAQFLEVLRGALPPLEPWHRPDEPWEPVPFDLQVYEFLKYWRERIEKSGHEYPWLPQLLTHVYGEERAVELLAESGIS